MVVLPISPNTDITDNYILTGVIAIVILYFLLQLFGKWYDRHLEKKEGQFKDEEIGKLY
ncbi:MAG: hypothetical protein J7K57_08360 [Palaeococcus sp.]|uniref:hypothetical protein n=1 Tax=Palaeococcus sp. (in: euryarchaeotes) TaxID=2820298 RepID=UPI0025D959F5|nr:hypothetical protein [Palaeococcus sp. (in: euryarchaeotes)]MCD6559856.1 hypothetical protein [Palaeococcus sp. (in: euryarchaeotes)]